MKQFLSISLIAGVLLLASCGSSNGSDISEPPQTTTPTSWQGQWRGFDSEGAEMFSVNIGADSIDIMWNRDDGTRALYWTGTFDPNAQGDVVSIGNTQAMSTAVFASTAEEKDFILKDGRYSFDVTVVGVTKTITIQK